MIDLVTTTMQSYYNIIDCISHAVHFIPKTQFFCNWKFLCLNYSYVFYSSPQPLPSANHLFVLCICECVPVPVFIMFVLLLSFSDSTSYNICLSLSNSFHLAFSSLQSLSHVQLCDPMNRSTPTSPSITNSWSLPKLMSSQWCHPAVSSSVVPYSSCPQSLPASGPFPMSQLFAWGGQSIGVSASVSVLPMNIQDWSPLRWTGWISLQSKDSQESSPTP